MPLGFLGLLVVAPTVLLVLTSLIVEEKEVAVLLVMVVVVAVVVDHGSVLIVTKRITVLIVDGIFMDVQPLSPVSSDLSLRVVSIFEEYHRLLVAESSPLLLLLKHRQLLLLHVLPLLAPGLSTPVLLLI